MTRRALLWLATLGCLSVACDDGEADGDPDADDEAGVDADADADRDGAPDTDVFEPPSSVQVLVDVYEGPGTGRVATEGATVTFDLPGGDRVEATTDADGLVAFDDIDWTGGETVAVTSVVRGWEVLTFAALTAEHIADRSEEEGLLHLTHFFRAFPPSYVEANGQAIMSDEVNNLTVSSTVPGVAHVGVESGSRWAVDVQPGVDFSLVAFEWTRDWSGRRLEQAVLGWSVTDHAAIDGRTRIDIDVTGTLTTESFEGTVTLPQSGIGSFFLVAYPEVYVSSLESELALVCGVPTFVDEPAHDGTWFYEGEYVALESLERPVTRYVFESSGRISQILVPGFPTGSPRELAFPEPPVPIDLSRDEAFSLGGDRSLEWFLNETDAVDPELIVQFLILHPMEETVFHRIDMPPGTTVLDVPPLPDDLDPIRTYGRVASGLIRLCEPDDDGIWCIRMASNVPFTVTP